MSTKQFTKAELDHLKERAIAANMAIGAHNEFVNFLRAQHEAPEQDGWQLGAKGFEMTAEKRIPSSAITDEGMNGILTEEVERFN